MNKWVGIFLLVIIAGMYLYYNPQVLSKLEGLTKFSIGTTDPKSLTQHPENYLNQNVTIIGSFFTLGNLVEDNVLSSVMYSTIQGFPLTYQFSSKNEEGKPIPIYVKYDSFYCVKCEITGIVKTIQVCNCESNTYANLPNFQSEWSSFGVALADYCINVLNKTYGLSGMYRCQSNSIHGLYYLDVTKVRLLD